MIVTVDSDRIGCSGSSSQHGGNGKAEFTFGDVSSVCRKTRYSVVVKKMVVFTLIKLATISKVMALGLTILYSTLVYLLVGTCSRME